MVLRTSARSTPAQATWRLSYGMPWPTRSAWSSRKRTGDRNRGGQEHEYHISSHGEWFAERLAQSRQDTRSRAFNPEPASPNDQRSELQTVTDGMPDWELTSACRIGAANVDAADPHRRAQIRQIFAVASRRWAISSGP